MDEAATNGEWRMRPLLLGVLGAAAGLAAHLILGNDYRFDLTAFEAAGLTFVTVAPGLLGFTLERRRWLWSIGFALVWGLVAAALIYWSGAPGGWDSAAGWRVFSLLLAIAIAAPLFQAARDAGAARFPYPAVHDHAWTNIVLWGASLVFTGITFLLVLLLGELFHLIRIELLRDLLRDNWFDRVVFGGAFGAGLGLLREREGLVRLLRSVATTVLVVLAPVLAFGLAIFVLALPITGLGALWEATRSTTPILLCCVVGALALANVVIGNAPEEEARNPVLRYAAMALAVTMLPLAVIAGIATGLRVGQYGYTPERLWALTFVLVATAFGLAYLVALARGRLRWAAFARPSNLVLAFGLCALALLLATPLISFNAIAARDQVARLEAGKVKPDDFDWRALAFDFGEPGRAALKRLEASSNPAIKAQAAKTAKAGTRWELDGPSELEQRKLAASNTRMLPAGTAMPSGLQELVASSFGCTEDNKCTLALVNEGKEALLFGDDCFAPPKPQAKGSSAFVASSIISTPCGLAGHYVLGAGKWAEAESAIKLTDALKAAQTQAYGKGEIEVRMVQRRQVFVGGVPVGEPFE